MLRILTEYKNRPNIEAELIARGLDYTIYTADGTWNGIKESSLVIEIEGANLSKVASAAEAIRSMNDQQAVYVQCIPTELYSITEEGRKCLTI
jgi:hypothetical protein